MIEKNTLHLTVNSAETLTEAFHLAGQQAVTRTARVEITVNGTIFFREPIFMENIAVPVVLTGKNAVFDGGYRFTDITKAGRNGKTVLRLKPDAGISEKLCRDALFADGNRRSRCSRAVGLMGMTEENGVLRDADDWLAHTVVSRGTEPLPVFTNTPETELHVCTAWLHERMKLRTADLAENRLETETAPILAIGRKSVCSVVNAPELLTEPGTYFYDSENDCYDYLPMAGEDEHTEFVVPMTDIFLDIRKVASLTIRGITFRYSRGYEGYQKQFPGTKLITRTHRQSECDMTGCVTFTECKNCEITGCTMEHLGAYAVDLRETNRNIRVTDCVFRDLGSGALKCHYKGKRKPLADGVMFADNTVRGYGVLYKAACAVLLTEVRYGEVLRNDISDGEYTAVSVGWTWGYDSTPYRNNRISGNHIYRIGKGNVNDMGAVYMLGMQPYTEISHNRIHDIRASEDVGCWGIYLDEGSSGITVSDNAVWNVTSEAMHIHYGRDNIVTRNIFAFCSGPLLSCTRAEEHVQLYVFRNVFVNPNGKMCRMREGFCSLVSDGNVFWADGAEPRFSHMAYLPNEQWISLDDWRKEQNNDRLSITADPMLSYDGQNMLTLREESLYQYILQN